MLKLKINSENAAFDQEGQEVARILRGLADHLENLDKLQECQQPLRDLNGNLVGYYKTWTDQDESQGAVISSPYATWKNIEDVVENALGEYPERLT
jgi:tRNA-dihydrouridine synthase